MQQTDVRWSGRSRAGLVLRPDDAYLIPLSLIWSAGATAATVAMVRGPTTGGPAFIWWIVFCIVGAYLLVGRFVVDVVRRSGLRYELTATEAIVTTRAGATRSVALLRAVPCIGLRRGAGGSGTILFGLGPSGRSDYSALGFGYGVVAFEAVPGAGAVFQACIDAIDAGGGGSVVWEGRPYAGIVLRWWDWGIALLNAIFVAAGLAAGAAGVWPVSLLFVCAGGYGIVGRLAVTASRRSATRYVLTERAAIVRADRPWGRELVVPLSGASVVTYRGEPNGRGTIVFGSDDLGVRMADQAGFFGGQPRVPAFELLEGPQVVYQRVMQARAGATAPGSG